MSRQMLPWFRAAGTNRESAIKMPCSKSKGKSASQGFNNSSQLSITLRLKDGCRESSIWSKNPGANTFSNDHPVADLGYAYASYRFYEPATPKNSDEKKVLWQITAAGSSSIRRITNNWHRKSRTQSAPRLLSARSLGLIGTRDQV